MIANVAIERAFGASEKSYRQPYVRYTVYNHILSRCLFQA